MVITQMANPQISRVCLFQILKSSATFRHFHVKTKIWAAGRVFLYEVEIEHFNLMETNYVFAKATENQNFVRKSQKNIGSANRKYGKPHRNFNLMETNYVFAKATENLNFVRKSQKNIGSANRKYGKPPRNCAFLNDGRECRGAFSKVFSLLANEKLVLLKTATVFFFKPLTHRQ
jgi:hypothetical protein